LPDWIATAHPGLEPVIARELSDHVHRGPIEPGAVPFTATLASGAALARRLHTPGRLQVQVTSGRVSTYGELAALVRRADWSPFLGRHTEVDVRVSSRESRLHHKDAIEKKVSYALRDAARKLPPGPRKGGHRGGRLHQRLHVRLLGDIATLSMDAGGELLHRRGWRQAQGKASLRENLASALLVLAGWEPDEPLLDPFCGAGTIPIEAALMARGQGPFVGRRLACEDWPSVTQPPSRRPASAVTVQISGFDKEPTAMDQSNENARRASVSIDFRLFDVAHLEAPAPLGLIVTNPPYGQRLGVDVGGVYAALGRALTGPLAGWRAVFLSPHASLARKVHPDAVRLTTFKNGGISVGVWAVEGEDA
jgi:putative N6-adenine-specific DNA methylase